MQACISTSCVAKGPGDEAKTQNLQNDPKDTQ
jgi:hypothetical protein